LTTPNEGGWTPLHLAAGRGHVDTVRVLLSVMPEIQILAKAKGGWTPLHLAAEQGHTNVAQLLLSDRFTPEQRAAQLTAPNEGGWTPLHFAVRHDYVDTVRVLLSVIPEKQILAQAKGGLMPLHLAAAYGHADTVRVLLSVMPKKQILAKARNDWTALHYAASHGRLKVVQLMLTPSEIITQKHIEDLLKAKTKNKETLLHLAAMNGNFEVVQFLLTPSGIITQNYIGDMLKAEDSDGFTPLHCVFSIETKDESTRVAMINIAYFLLDAFRQRGIDIAKTFRNKAIEKWGTIWKNFGRGLAGSSVVAKFAGKVIDFNPLKEFLSEQISHIDTWRDIVRETENYCRGIFNILAFTKNDNLIDVEKLAATFLDDYGVNVGNFWALLKECHVPIDHARPSFGQICDLLDEYSRTAADIHLSSFLKNKGVQVECLLLGLLREGGFNIKIFLSVLHDKGVNIGSLLALVGEFGIDPALLLRILEASYGVNIGELSLLRR
jgi:ankyrin repeat protein